MRHCHQPVVRAGTQPQEGSRRPPTTGWRTAAAAHHAESPGCLAVGRQVRSPNCVAGQLGAGHHRWWILRHWIILCGRRVQRQQSRLDHRTAFSGEEQPRRCVAGLLRADSLRGRFDELWIPYICSRRLRSLPPRILQHPPRLRPLPRRLLGSSLQGAGGGLPAVPRWHVQRGDGGGVGAEVRGLRCGVVRGTGSWSGAVGAESAEGFVRCEPGTYGVAAEGELERQLRGVLAGAGPGRRGRCGMQGMLDWGRAAPRRWRCRSRVLRSATVRA